MLGVTERTIQRDWEKARIFLFRRLNRTLCSHADPSSDTPPG